AEAAGRHRARGLRGGGEPRGSGLRGLHLAAVANVSRQAHVGGRRGRAPVPRTGLQGCPSPSSGPRRGGGGTDGAGGQRRGTLQGADPAAAAAAAAAGAGTV
ncbi:unnamed protein product, partial [Scytosiphon promiscuus]